MPWLTVFAGPNGSGKSTLFREMSASGIEFGSQYINADDLAAEERSKRESLGLPVNTSKLEYWAFERAQYLRDQALGAGRNFCFETVFSHESKLDYLKRARAAGFQIRLFFVSTENSRLNVARVKKRVLEGGHDVPVDRIVNRYLRTMALLPDASMFADETVLFDNSDRTMRAVARLSWSDDGRPLFELRKPLPKWIVAWADQMRDRLER